MNNRIIVAFFLAIGCSVIYGFDDHFNDFESPTIATPRQRKLQRVEDKLYHEWHGYPYDQSNHQPLVTNIKFWDLERVPSINHYNGRPNYTLGDFDPNYSYQKMEATNKDVRIHAIHFQRSHLLKI